LVYPTVAPIFYQIDPGCDAARNLLRALVAPTETSLVSGSQDAHRTPHDDLRRSDAPTVGELSWLIASVASADVLPDGEFKAVTFINQFPTCFALSIPQPK
jgi:hypothetical protein